MLKKKELEERKIWLKLKYELMEEKENNKEE